MSESLTPEASFDTLKKNTVNAIQSYFPFEGRKQKLVLSNLHVDDKLEHDDIRSQAEAKDKETTWGVPIKADVSLVDKVTGKVIDTKKNTTLARLPKMTSRYGFIVNGSEYQVDHLFRLKSGAYARVQDNGDLETEFNLPGGGFSVKLDNKTKKFSLKVDGTHIPLYPLLKCLGVPDDQLEHQWGKEIYATNKPKDEERFTKALHSFWQKTADEGATEPKDIGDYGKYVHNFFTSKATRADTTAQTLGKGFTNINGDALSRAAEKILNVAKGTDKPDDRDSLAFKEVVGVEDFIPEKIALGAKRTILSRLRNNIDHKQIVGDILSTDTFNRPIHDFFVKGGSVTERSDQTNPVQMLSAHRKTTLMSKDLGGIKADHQITIDMRTVNPSHFGFLDAMHTPESERTGVTLHLGIGVKKNGKDLETSVYDLASKKSIEVKVPQFHQATVVLPDQVTWKDGKPTPVAALVKAKLPGGDIKKIPFKDAQFVMPSAKGMYDYASNLIPFLQCDQGIRVSMADKQMEQAISLKNREAPLVQSKSDSKDQKHTFEDLVGHFASTSAPVDGKVVAVRKDAIIISDGKHKHEAQIYDHFPLNDPKGMMHSSPLVQVGDTVKKGQVIADSNYTRNGTLAIGTNLQVGYLPYKGYNYEDGIVISESASKKLTSDHLYKKDLEIDPTVDHISKEKYRAHAAARSTAMKKEHLDALDESGIVRVGTKVEPGQIMVAAVGKNTVSRQASAMRNLGKRAFQPYKDKSLYWDEDHAGVVTRIVKPGSGKSVKVYVTTEEPAVVGDKLSGRHGNKGIITQILPDHEMPFTHLANGDRRPLELLLNPSGVPTRINVGQVLETAAGKIAEKTGKPYIVNNFDSASPNFYKQVTEDLAKNNLSATEDVFDPNDIRRPIGSVSVGQQFMLKLKHQVDKKLTVRGGGTNVAGRPLKYTADRQPDRGGDNGGQGFGQLDLYALLGHNARANLREMATYKSDMQDASFWSLVQTNRPIPPPKPPFSYEKFTALLNGLGVNVTKVGSSIRLQPLTDAEILKKAGGGKNEVKTGKMLRAKDLKEEPGGLFDLKATGGRDGDKWSYLKLREPMPNPVFVGQKAGPIPTLLDLRMKDIDDIMAGKHSIDGKVGGAAIEAALQKIDVNKSIIEMKKALPDLQGPALDKVNKKLKYLLALKDFGMTPQDAYMLHNIPILPPKFRPAVETPAGDVNYFPLNGIYKNIAMLNDQLAKYDSSTFSPEHKNPLRDQLWNSLKALQAVGKYKPVFDTDQSGNRSLKGILHIIGGGEGEQPKDGFFQDKLIKRRQDLSIRSTIVPEPALGLDEVGLPRNAAMELYKPFVVAQLTRWGLDPLPAQDEIKKNTPLAFKALEQAVADRPLLLKRDPVLHKFSVMAFKPKIVSGKAIQIHPLVTGGFNADFDGDTMAGTVPLTREAVEEAKKMFPSQNLFSPTTGNAMYVPSQEALLGLHLLTKWGKPSGKVFPDIATLKKAVDDGQLDVNDRVKLKGAAKGTTLGRLLIAGALPPGFSQNMDVLHNPDYEIKKGTMNAMAEKLAKEHTGSFAKNINSLKDLGNEWSFKKGFSIGLEDLKPLEGRDAILASHQKRVDKINSSVSNHDERDKQSVAVWTEATKALDDLAEKTFKKSGNRLGTLVYSGARGKKDQLRQMVAAPMLMQDSTNRILPNPVLRSYAEGLDVGDYWLAQHGARKGILQRALGTSEPGAISKDILNSTMATTIVSPDCGTHQGILMSLVPKEDDKSYKDINDRFLAAPYKLKDGTLVKAGTLITPALVSRLHNSKYEKVLARSPLKCEHGDGICAKCFGLNENGVLHDVGTNIGVLAGQALGEPAVQMAMDAFHSGGIASSERGAKSVDRFTRLRNLLEMPRKLRDEATVSQVSGQVTDIKKDPTGLGVYVNGIRHFVPHNLESDTLKEGATVRKGDRLSEGYVNPHHMLAATGDIHAVQNYLVRDMHEGLYDKEGVRRRNVEVAVRALTNLTKIKNPGDSEYLRGDIVPRSIVEEHNRQLPKGAEPILHSPILKGVEQIPAHASTNWMGRLNYQGIPTTIQQAAAQGWKSDLHGSHPIPGIAYGAEFGKAPADKPKHVY